MNPFLLWNIVSFRKELLYVATTFILILLLPLVGIIVITQTGINAVSEQLAVLDTASKVVQLKNPLNGTVYKELEGPFIWPVTGRITLEFGDSSIFQPFHAGIDIASKRNDPIGAFMPGKVIYAGEINWGFGRHIIIDHGDNVTSVYAHLEKISVKKGDDVKQGQVIGTQGKTGWATGYHLHFETRVMGVPVNPMVFLGN
jgi:murein DD-endopeptidase MepM/ murein hydrolase activator NlpD